MTVHYASNFDDATRSKRRKRNTRISIISAVAAVALTLGGVAFAQMLIDSKTATASATAGEAKQIELSGAKFSGPIYPGMAVDLTVVAANPNPFPVKLTAIVLAGNPTITCSGGASDAAKISGPLGAATSYTLPTAVTIAANGDADVKVNDAVKMSSSAGAGCAISVPFKLTGVGAAAGN